MHASAYDFVAKWARRLGPRKRVLELGSRDVNGSVRGLFPGAFYLGVDSRPGPGVDLVADAAKYETEELFDLVVSTEVLEHAADAQGICDTAYDALVPGGVFLVTAAGPNRGPHGVDGGPVGREYYANVHYADLCHWLALFGMFHVETMHGGHDIYGIAVRIAR